jgi:hypothetical protein
MFAVALFSLGTPVDDEARALADDLGTTAYEERLRLASGLPLIVRTFAEADDARALLARLRARGHGAVACDGRAVVEAASRVTIRAFSLGIDGLELPGPPVPRSMRYDGMLALVRARHRAEVRTLTTVREQRIIAGRAMLSVGLVTKKGTTPTEIADEQVLYLFPESGDAPWILRERSAQYAGLGPLLQPSSLQNFLTVVTELRARAPGAAYDERLLSVRGIPSQLRRQGPAGAEVHALSDADGVALLAQLTAFWLGRRER